MRSQELPRRERDALTAGRRRALLEGMSFSLIMVVAAAGQHPARLARRFSRPAGPRHRPVAPSRRLGGNPASQRRSRRNGATCGAPPVAPRAHRPRCLFDGSFMNEPMIDVRVVRRDVSSREIRIIGIVQNRALEVCLKRNCQRFDAFLFNIEHKCPVQDAIIDRDR